jgi:murein DD-endopeptidase MepM/ murein hydrolase activator NlpD
MSRLCPAVLVVCLFLAACAPYAAQPGTPSPTPVSTDTRQPTASPSPSPTLEFFSLPVEDTPTPFPTETPLPLPTLTVSALQLFFPTVIPVAGAEYRPPLYSVPWALSPHDHFYFARPISAYYPGEPVADYRYGGIFFGPDVIHTGIDLPAPRGTDVLAAGPGTVVWAGVGLYLGSIWNLNDPYGKAVAIRHDFGYKDQPLYTVYAHMDEIDVTLGQWVNTGAVVGHVGTTGLTTGPHLHFEVRLGDNDFWKTRNPELWIAPPQGFGVLAGRVKSTGGTNLNSYLVIVKNLDTKKVINVRTYGPMTVNTDAYFRENVVLGDLPAGLYELNIPYGALNRKATIEILPGQITYFSFQGFAGYNFTLPADPDQVLVGP